MASPIKWLSTAIVVLMSLMCITCAARQQPPLATATPAGTATVTANAIKATDPITQSPTTEAAGRPSLATATPRSPVSTATIVNNGITKSTGASTTPGPTHEELNATSATGSPTIITPVENNSTDAATSESDEGINITDSTGAPIVATETTVTPFESNGTDEIEVNTTATTSSPTAIVKTVPEKVNNTDITATDDIITTTDTSTINDRVIETTTPSNGAKAGPITESRGSTGAHSSRPLLKGITLTGLIVASILGGLTLLIIFVTVSVIIAVKIHKQRFIRRERREVVNATNVLAVHNYVPWQEFEVTKNAAYRTGLGQQARAVYYPSRPSDGAVLSRSNRPKAMLPPGRYARLNNQKIEASIDSEGYVKIPRPFV